MMILTTFSKVFDKVISNCSVSKVFSDAFLCPEIFFLIFAVGHVIN